MKAEVKDGCGPNKGAESRVVGSGHFTTPSSIWRCQCDPLLPVWSLLCKMQSRSFYRCVIKIKMKAKVKDGSGPNKGTESKRVESGHFMPLVRFGVVGVISAQHGL